MPRARIVSQEHVAAQEQAGHRGFAPRAGCAGAEAHSKLSGDSHGSARGYFFDPPQFRSYLRVMSSPHLAKRSSHAGVVSRDPLPALAEALGSVLMLHRELMAERDETLRLTREMCGHQQALAEMRSYAELLERELTRLQATQRSDVEGWR